jgi:uncharacterized protein
MEMLNVEIKKIPEDEMIPPKILLCFLSAVALLSSTIAAQEKGAEKCKSFQEYLSNDGYDAQLAAQFGGERNGMRKYVMAFLRRGPNRPADPQKAQELQAAHMKNIGRMAAEGKLVLAGPFLEDGELRGIYVFSVATLAEAEALTNTDPAIKAGSLVMELKEWYGSAALMAAGAIHKKIALPPVSESAR